MIGQTVVDLLFDALVRTPIAARAAPAIIAAAQTLIAQPPPLRLFITKPRSDLIGDAIPPTTLTPARIARVLWFAFAAAAQSPLAASFVIVIAARPTLVIACGARAVVVAFVAFVVAPVVARITISAAVIAPGHAVIVAFAFVIALKPAPVAACVTAVSVLAFVTGVAHVCAALVIAAVVARVDRESVG